MSSIHGVNASGRKSELKASTGANPFGSGFGSGHALTPDRSGLRCVGASALSVPSPPAVETLLSPPCPAGRGAFRLLLKHVVVPRLLKATSPRWQYGCALGRGGEGLPSRRSGLFRPQAVGR